MKGAYEWYIEAKAKSITVDFTFPDTGETSPLDVDSIMMLAGCNSPIRDGDSFHAACGMCPEHDEPRVLCGCRKTLPTSCLASVVVDG